MKTHSTTVSTTPVIQPIMKVTKKRYRIPTKLEATISKIKAKLPLTIEQTKLKNHIVEEYIKDYNEMRKKMRKLVMLLRIQEDVLVLEDGEIMG